MPAEEIRISPSGPFLNVLTADSLSQSFFHWGSLAINTGGQPNFIYPGFANFQSINKRLEIAWTFDCIFDQMRVRARVAGTGGNQLRYRLDINALDSGLEVLMLNTATVGDNLIDSAAVMAGDLLSLRVSKQGGPIATSPMDILVSFRIRSLML